MDLMMPKGEEFRTTDANIIYKIPKCELVSFVRVIVPLMPNVPFWEQIKKYNKKKNTIFPSFYYMNRYSRVENIICSTKLT